MPVSKVKISQTTEIRLKNSINQGHERIKKRLGKH